MRLYTVERFEMKALILAGGSGTRLRPLTCTRSKQLLPLASSTLIGYMLDRLHDAGVSEVILATGPEIDDLQDSLGDGANHNITLHYSIETQPLGTAGAIKHAEQYLHKDKTFLVLNGDIVSDINYAQLIQFHEQQQATATITLFRVEDPSRFGVVEIDSEKQIHNFVEKPDLKHAPSNLINAGCYVLDNTVLAQIPANQEVSIEREVFPTLCQSSKVFGWEHQGIWVDTGTPESFLEAHQALITETSQIPLIGAKTKIAPSADIGENVTIGKRAIIGPNTHINDAVLFDDVIIGAGVTIEQSIIGQGAVIGKDLQLKKHVIVGDGAIIDSGANIPPGSLICPQCHVKKGETPPPCFVKNFKSLSV